MLSEEHAEPRAHLKVRFQEAEEIVGEDEELSQHSRSTSVSPDRSSEVDDPSEVNGEGT